MDNDVIYIVTVKTEDYMQSECYHTLATALDIAEHIVSTQSYIYVVVIMIDTIEGKPSVVKLYSKCND